MSETTLSPQLRGPEVADKLLSFVVVGRNDNYMGDYRYRLTTALNFLARSLASIDRLKDVEVMVCDWNSPVPLHEELQLVPQAKDLLRFIVVPPSIAIPTQKDSSFPNCICHNIAIRRSSGKYVSVADADIVYTRSALRIIFDVLEGRLPIGVPVDEAFLVAHRRQVPVTRSARRPSLGELETFLNRNQTNLRRDELITGLGVPAGIALMHRKHWFTTHGYDERLTHWGWIDVDLHLRMSQKYPWVDLSNHGCELVHLEHYAGPKGRGEGPPRKCNEQLVTPAFHVNGPDWGMANHTFEIHSPEKLTADVDPPPPASPLASWNETIQQIQQELLDPLVHQTVAAVLDPLQIGRQEHNAMLALAWYSLKHFPRNYLEIGVRRSHGAGIVARACPGVEIYGIDTWQVDSFGGNVPPPHYASNVISGLGRHLGYVHFISGDPTTAQERLFSSHGAPTSIDLTLVRAHPAFGDPIKQACDLLPRISPGGAMIVTSHAPTIFHSVWDALRTRFADRYYVQFEGQEQTGIVLAATLRG